jgi:hypothetical protein
MRLQRLHPLLAYPLLLGAAVGIILSLTGLSVVVSDAYAHWGKEAPYAHWGKEAPAAPELTVMTFVEQADGVWEWRPAPEALRRDGHRVLALWLEEGKPLRIEEWRLPAHNPEEVLCSPRATPSTPGTK